MMGFRGFCRFWLPALAIVLICPSAVRATAQFPETLFLDGNEAFMFNEPLEAYFRQGRARPRVFEEGGVCTACWRGYVGAWKIENKALYLTALHDCGCGEEPKEIPLSEVFENPAPPILADWYTGILRVPRGDQLMYVHMGFASQYEKELLIKVVNGRVVERRILDNTLLTEAELRERMGKTYEELFEAAGNE